MRHADPITSAQAVQRRNEIAKDFVNAKAGFICCRYCPGGRLFTPAYYSQDLHWRSARHQEAKRAVLAGEAPPAPVLERRRPAAQRVAPEQKQARAERDSQRRANDHDLALASVLAALHRTEWRSKNVLARHAGMSADKAGRCVRELEAQGAASVRQELQQRGSLRTVLVKVWRRA